MDDRFGRSTFHHFKPFHSYFALSTNRIHHSIFHIKYESRVLGIVMMKDLLNHFIRIHFILSIIVDTDSWNASSPSSMDCSFGRSNHSNILYQFNTSNHKRAVIEIARKLSYFPNLNGL